MSSLYRRNGIYWLSFRRNGKPYCRSLKTRDRSTAIYKKAEIDKGLIEGKAILPDKGILLSDLRAQYEKEYQHNKASSTLKKDISQLNSFFEYTGNIRVSELTEEMIRGYFNKRMDSGELKDKAANRYIAIIKHFLNFAVRKRYIFENPARFVKRFKVDKNPVRFLSKEEIQRVLGSAADKDLYADQKTTLYPLIATAIYTGMRQKELFTLRWEDIDFKKGVINVLNKPGFKTKTRKWRPIPLHKDLKKILLSSKNGSENCFDVTNWRRILKRILQEAKLDGQGVAWHTFRHTFASHLVMNGTPLATVSELLGHSSISTTMIYSHLSADHVKDAIRKLEF